MYMLWKNSGNPINGGRKFLYLPLTLTLTLLTLPIVLTLVTLLLSTVFKVVQEFGTAVYRIAKTPSSIRKPLARWIGLHKCA